ncbi:MAG: hypothetical protein IKI09_12135 [Bacteroidales bacterium]|nr:hypothetical protein [Bacteroidales bacterium]
MTRNFVTKRKDGKPDGLPQNSAGWGKTGSSGLPPRHCKCLPLAGRIQTIGGETTRHPRIAWQNEEGKRTATNNN